MNEQDDMISPRAVGKRIRQARKALNIKQIDLAATTGIRQVELSQLEAGGWKTIRIERISRIAMALRIDAGWLLMGEMRPRGSLYQG